MLEQSTFFCVLVLLFCRECRTWSNYYVIYSILIFIRRFCGRFGICQQFLFDFPFQSSAMPVSTWIGLYLFVEIRFYFIIFWLDYWIWFLWKNFFFTLLREVCGSWSENFTIFLLKIRFVLILRQNWIKILNWFEASRLK